MLQEEDNRRLESVEGKISEVEGVGIETIWMEIEKEKKAKINEYSLRNWNPRRQEVGRISIWWNKGKTFSDLIKSTKL